MKPQFKEGLHLAIVTNPRPGQGGSLLALETYQSCLQLGLPAILATFHTSRPYPMPETDLRRLPNPGIGNRRTGMTAAERYCLLPILDEARDGKKMVIIDTPPGYSEEDAMFEILREASLGDATSTAALIAVQHALMGWDAIRDTCKPFAAVGARFDRGLVRDWGLRRSDRVPTPGDPPLQRWSPPFLTKEVMDWAPAYSIPAGELGREGDAWGPADDELRKSLSAYRNSAQTAVWNAIIEPITLSDPD